MLDFDQSQSSAWNPSMFSNVIIGALTPDASVSDLMHRMLTRATTRLLDTEIIVESPYRGEIEPRNDYVSGEALPKVLLQPLEEILGTIRVEGLSPHFKTLLAGFSRLTSSFFLGSSLPAVREGGAERDLRTVFMMTDAGGASFSEWKSREIMKDGVMHLLIDKIWIMGSDHARYGIVAVRNERALYPIPYLLTPGECQSLEWTPTGDPFLSNSLQLGSLRGVVRVGKENQIDSGGFAMMNRCLTIVRPYFVRAILTYLTWLEGQGRLEARHEHKNLVKELQDISLGLCDGGRYSNVRLQQALALKFALNELLLTLVVEGCLKEQGDARDLLAFSKMEGSSYRCFRELYRRAVPVKRSLSIITSEKIS